ncbi:alpha/beta hydrolase [Geminicoccaceae bacterium 1502E]|nr:alpha/beta hydrolase [Geminicoccaceae bacterium 1502E]
MRLYRDFTSQEELDREYNPGAALPESAALIEGWAARSERARATLPCETGLRFGPSLDEYLDLYPAGPGTPLHVFVHGGYWRRFTAREHGFVAPALVGAGVSVAVLNYALCPKVTIDEIVRQVRAALAWLHAHAGRYDCDPARITLSGHSAGGHLTAMALLTDWPGDYGLPEDLVKGGLAISGLFDLAPFPYTYLQPSLQLGWDQVRRNSPILHLPPSAAPLDVAVGGAESVEFRRQSRDFHAAWQERGLDGDLLEVPDANHFTVLEELERPQSPLLASLLARARAR